jgi:16S rRNA (adenine1518-N6/adenine1519-N6)-dimethyltransferase
MYNVRPKKHLGQHFLKDENIARKIADSLSVDTRRVLEIGPGTGVLTKYLLAKGYEEFRTIEIDRESIEYLKTSFPGLSGGLIEGDFLDADLQDVFPGNFSIIGNFPYNISSQIFFRVLENRNRIPEVVGMVQKEVAMRIASPPGSKAYGILSVLLQAWYDIEYLFSVHPGVFAPPPKVTSAVIRLRRNSVSHLGCDPVFFQQIVKASFNQRRKTLHNALKSIGGYAGKYASKRAEQLSVDQFIELTKEMLPLQP